MSLVLGVLFLAPLGAGIGLWLRARPRPVKGHWDAVARADAYMRMGRPDRAFETVRDIRDDAPGSGEAMTIAGMALIRFGEYRAARLALERAIQLQPKQYEAAMALADLNFGLGNGRRGLEVLEQAARLRPGEPRVWLTMARVENDLGVFSKAIQAYERVLAMEPAHHDALAGLIRALFASDQTEEAEPWLRRALAAYSEDPVFLSFGAQAAFESNRLDEAIELASRTLARDPEDSVALITRGRARIARAHWEDALSDAERAVAIEPSNLSALQLLLKIETRLGLKVRAAATHDANERAKERINLMDQLNTQISLNPDDPELPWKMGEAAREGNSFLLASRCFEASLALDPNFQPARDSLAKLRQARPELARPSSRLAPSPGSGAAGRGAPGRVP
jgi:tetratricopeptide (TPR) repeat protein